MSDFVTRGESPGSTPSPRPRMDMCQRHHRWTFIQRADGTNARRDCPECPRPRGARIVNQFTGEVVGRMPPELVREEDWFPQKRIYGPEGGIRVAGT